MAQLVMLTATRRPRPRRTWDDEELGGFREAEAREAKAQRDSDTRERAERDRESRGEKPSAPAKQKSGMAKLKDWFNNTRLGKGLKAVGRGAASMVTGGMSEVAIRGYGVVKGAVDRRAARSSVSGTTRGSSGPSSRAGGIGNRERSSDGRDGRFVSVLSMRQAIAATPAVTPTPATLDTSPASVAAPTYITAPQAQQPMPLMTLQAAQAQRMTPMAGEWPTERPWMDGESIPGVKNKTLVIAAGALLGATLLMRRK